MADRDASDLHVVMAHTYDPRALRQGGAIRYAHNLLMGLAARGATTTLLGIDLAEGGAPPPYPFLGISRSSAWHRYVVALYGRIPRLKLPREAIFHTCRMEFMLPIVQTRPGHGKVFTSDTPLLSMGPRYPRTIAAIRPVYQRMAAFEIQRIDRIVTNARTREYYEQRYPAARGKVVTMATSGVDQGFVPRPRDEERQALGIDRDALVVAFVGRIERVKDCHFLVRAFAAARRIEPKALLVFIGDGSDRAGLEKLVRDLGLAAHVRFVGARPPAEVPSWLSASDVLAVTSLSEGGPAVVKEAIACGTPVVSAPVGDVALVLTDPLLGRVVEKDEARFAEALVEVGRHDRDKTREACAAAAPRFSFDRVVDSMVDLYRSVLRERGLA